MHIERPLSVIIYGPIVAYLAYLAGTNAFSAVMYLAKVGFDWSAIAYLALIPLGIAWILYETRD